MDLDSSSDSFVDSLKLPTFPSTVARIDAVLQDEEFELATLAGIVEKDPPIAASVLRSANSAFYALAEPVDCVRDAVGTLGASNIRNLAFQASLVSDYKHLSKYPEFDLRTLWKHSILTAQVAQKFATAGGSLRPGGGDLAYTAGLLHDIGKIVLLDSMGEFFLEAVRDAHRTGRRAVESEDSILGMNHAVTGSLVAFAWKLSEEVSQAIEYHHDPERGGSNPTLDAVTLADHVTRYFEDDETPDADEVAAHPACARLGVERPALESILAFAAESWLEISF